MTATHIRNRCYSQRIHNTPYDLITGLKPNVAKLHAFGTVCYAYTHNAKMLDPRSKKGLFVGYDKESPSYFVYYPETRSVMKHRLVKFTDKFNTTEPLVEENVKQEQPSQPLPSKTIDNEEQRYPSRN